MDTNLMALCELVFVYLWMMIILCYVVAVLISYELLDVDRCCLKISEDLNGQKFS